MVLRDELRYWFPVVITVDLGCVSCSYPSRDPISDVYMFYQRAPAGFSVFILISVPFFTAYSLANSYSFS